MEPPPLPSNANLAGLRRQGDQQERRGPPLPMLSKYTIQDPVSVHISRFDFFSQNVSPNFPFLSRMENLAF